MSSISIKVPSPKNQKDTFQSLCQKLGKMDGLQTLTDKIDVCDKTSSINIFGKQFQGTVSVKKKGNASEVNVSLKLSLTLRLLKKKIQDKLESSLSKILKD